MPPSDLQIRQGNLWVRLRHLEKRFDKDQLFTEPQFEEFHRLLIELDEDLIKLRSDIYK